MALLRRLVRNALDVGHYVYGSVARFLPAREVDLTATSPGGPFTMRLHRPGHLEDVIAWTGLAHKVGN